MEKLTDDQISDEKIDNIIKHISTFSVLADGTPDEIMIDKWDLLELAYEVKERRESDEKTLAIKDQLRMVRDKCPDIWDIIHNNWYSIFGFSLCHKFKYEIFKEGKE
jgi:hypothetical protein